MVFPPLPLALSQAAIEFLLPQSLLQGLDSAQLGVGLPALPLDKQLPLRLSHDMHQAAPNLPLFAQN
jgi:hypothetical protein